VLQLVDTIVNGKEVNLAIFCHHAMAGAHGPCHRLVPLPLPPSFLALRVCHDLAMLTHASPGLVVARNGQHAAM
jgi:hypothetical protein